MPSLRQLRPVAWTGGRLRSTPTGLKIETPLFEWPSSMEECQQTSAKGTSFKPALATERRAPPESSANGNLRLRTRDGRRAKPAPKRAISWSDSPRRMSASSIMNVSPPRCWVGYPGSVDGYQVKFRVPSDTAQGLATIQVGAASIAAIPMPAKGSEAGSGIGTAPPIGLRARCCSCLRRSFYVRQVERLPPNSSAQ